MKRQIALILILILVTNVYSKKQNYDESMNEARRIMVRQTPKAIKILTKLIEQEPDNPQAYAVLGIIYYNTSEFEKGGIHFKHAIELIKNKSDKRASIEAIDKVTSRFRSQEEADLYEKAYNAIELGQSAIAIELIENALKLNPGNTKLYYEIGYAYVDLQKHNKALYYFEKSRVINPVNITTLKELAYVYSHQKQYNKVHEVLIDTINFHGESPFVYHELAISYFRAGNNKMGEQTLKLNITKFSNYYPSYYTLGQYYFDNGKKKEAKPFLEAVKKNMTKRIFEKYNIKQDWSKIQKSTSKMLSEM